MNKSIGALISLLLTVAILSGCSGATLNDPLIGETAVPLTTGAIPPLTTPTYYTPPMPEQDEFHTPAYQLQLLADRDFNGQIFLVIQEEGMESAIFPTADDFTSAYADRRNRLVQEKYNVELACIKMSREEILSALQDAKSRGEYFCDLLIVTPSLLTQLKNNGCLYALETLPFFQIDSICIRNDATAEINSNWKGIYGIWGDALRQPSQAYTVYYNRSLANQLGCPNLYNLVQSGQWDFQIFTYLASQGKYTFDGNIADLLFASAGFQSTSEEGKALPANEEYLALLESLNKSSILPPAEPEAADESAPSTEEEPLTPITFAKETFLAGKSLFYIGTLGELSELADAPLQTGLLPLPKYDPTATNYPYLTNQAELPVFACPIHATSTEGTGIMLSALNAASCAELEELFLQSAENQVRDNGSCLMLPYCIGTLFFDRKLIYP